MLRLFDVIVVLDVTARNPKPRMMVCISPDEGEFLRINSRDKFRPCVPIHRLPDHRFLDHDSFIEVNILVLDEFVVEQCLGRSGVIGRVHDGMKDPILECIDGLTYISAADKARIRRDFGAV